MTSGCRTLVLVVAWSLAACASNTAGVAQTTRPTAPVVDATLAPAAQTLWNSYERALYDSAVYENANIRPLRPLVPDADGNVLVVTLTKWDAEPGTTLTAGKGGSWVTGVPEVQAICRGFRGDIVMQLRQLLGLPPDAEENWFLLLRARAADIFRPATDDLTSTRFPCAIADAAAVPSDCGNVIPDTTTPAHYAWMASSSFSLHQVPSGYPWTHLGYTYNWMPGADRYGASEYVIRPKATATVLQHIPPAEYCAPATQ